MANTTEIMEGTKNKNNFKRILHVICIVGFLGCAVWLIFYFVSLRNNSTQTDELKDNYVLTPASVEDESIDSETKVSESEDSKPTEPEPEPRLFGGREYPDLAGLDVPDLEIDFNGLWEVNPDVYAWLYVPDTNIDYPVLQREGEAEYYLERDIEGKKNAAGAIFTQYYNSKEWTDNHTVIYGHNMRNKSMFATLHNFEDTKFFEEHPYFYIYTPEHTLVYQVFGAYEYSNAHLLLGYNMNDHDSFGQYLESVLALDGLKTNINRDIDVTADDRIVTLSTCVGSNSEHRYLVQAKLTAVGWNTDAGEAADDGEITGTANAGTDE